MSKNTIAILAMQEYPKSKHDFLSGRSHMPITFYGPGGTKMFFHKGTPERCRQQVTRALEAHPNARRKVVEDDEIDEAATLLAIDGYLTSAHWLVQYCKQGAHT